MSTKKVLFLASFDGTLTKPMEPIAVDMESFLLQNVVPKVEMAVVTKLDYGTLSERIQSADLLCNFYYLFTENGLVAHQFDKEFFTQHLQDYLGEEKLQKLINYILRYLSDLTLPLKRGTFIDLRTSLLEICPPGESCNPIETIRFQTYDAKSGVRKKFIEKLKANFCDYGLQYEIKEPTSVLITPNEWSSIFCMRHIPKEEFEEIHFFTNNADNGQSDCALFQSPRLTSHKVKDPAHVIEKMKEILEQKKL